MSTSPAKLHHPRSAQTLKAIAEIKRQDPSPLRKALTTETTGPRIRRGAPTGLNYQPQPFPLPLSKPSKEGRKPNRWRLAWAFLCSGLAWTVGAGVSLANEPVAVASAIEFVGRINTAGFKTRGSCTGFQLVDGYIVTARHCIPQRPHDTVHFVRGYEKGAYIDHLKAPASDFRISMENDIAVLCEKRLGSGGLPLSTQTPTPESRIAVLGYGRPAANILTTSSCRFIGWGRQREFYLDCPVTSGTSGGPVLIQDGGKWEILGVVSASGDTLSSATWLEPKTIAGLCE